MQTTTGGYQLPLMLGAPSSFVLGVVMVLTGSVALAVGIALWIWGTAE
ncbi:hypothetical protein [Crossiella sp. NPDC003009]